MASATEFSGKIAPAPGPAGSTRIQVGGTMRLRSRALLAVAFALALPALLVAVVRITGADRQAQLFDRSHALSEGVRTLQLQLEQVRTALWRFEAEPNVDARRQLRRALDDLSRGMLATEAIANLELEDPGLAALVATWKDEKGDALMPIKDPMSSVRGALGRTRRAIDPLLLSSSTKKPDPAAVRRAHAALGSATRDLSLMAGLAHRMTEESLHGAVGALSYAGRDQLVMFLLLLFACPLVVGFGPGLILGPLSRLRAAAVKIQAGRGRELVAVGNDEVADVVRALGRSMKKLEAQDQKKTRKIFEMRKLLRSVLHQVKEPVLVIGRGDVIDYANEEASELFGHEIHNLERKVLEDVCFAPQLVEAIELAREGDANDDGVEVTLESGDGRVQNFRVFLGGIVDETGRTTRVVLVFS